MNYSGPFLFRVFSIQSNNNHCPKQVDIFMNETPM